MLDNNESCWVKTSQDPALLRAFAAEIKARRVLSDSSSVGIRCRLKLNFYREAWKCDDHSVADEPDSRRGRAASLSSGTNAFDDEPVPLSTCHALDSVCQKPLRQDALNIDLDGTVYALDATTIDL